MSEIVYMHGIFENEKSVGPVRGGVSTDKRELEERVDMMRELGYTESHIRTMTVEFGGWCR